MRRPSILLSAVVIQICMAFLSNNQAFGDESRPLYIGITEITEGGYRLDWRIPPVLPVRALPNIRLPEDCKNSEARQGSIHAYEGSAFYACTSGLAGRDIQIAYPMFNPALATMIRTRALNGEEHLGVLSPQESSWRIPDAETQMGIALQYTRLGVEHILVGWDHLLFVACLLWIAGGVRRILVAVTGFTAAHSVTLILSSLQLIYVPVPPTEAVIALSIVFLAREIAVNRKDSLTWRFPVAVSTSFGLLHGLGFASVLTQVGLPQTAMLTGLLCFNIGVEIGQVLFIAALGILYFAGRAMIDRWLKRRFATVRRLMSAERLQFASSYAVGIISTYWFVSRAAGFVISQR